MGRFLIILLLLACSCSSNKDTVSSALPDIAEATLAPALPDAQQLQTALQDLPVPAEVDPGIFEELKRELSRLLAEQRLERSTSSLRGTMPAALHYSSGALRWSYLHPGDYDQNGEVNIADLSALATSFGKRGPFAAGSREGLIDGDGNGEIGLSDVSPIAANFGSLISEYCVFRSNDPADYGRQAGGKARLVGSTVLADGKGSGRLQFSFQTVMQNGYCYWVTPMSGQQPGSPSMCIPDAPWPAVGADLRRSLCSPYVGSDGPGIVWQQQLPDGFGGRPLIHSSGNLIFTSYEDGVLMYSPAGELLWRNTMPDRLKGNTVIAADGLIYAPAYDGRLYAISQSGEVELVYDGANEVVCVLPMDGHLRVLEFSEFMLSLHAMNGTQLWEVAIKNPNGFVMPLLDSRNRIIIGSINRTVDTTIVEGKCVPGAVSGPGGQIDCISPAGEIEWTIVTGDSYPPAPALGQADSIIVSTEEMFLQTFSPDGVLQWEHSLWGRARHAPAVAADGSLITPATYGGMRRILPGGMESWSGADSDYFREIPTLDAAGKSYAICNPGELLCLDRYGREVWKTQFPDRLSSPPSIDANGVLYTTDRHGMLYAIGSSTLNQVPVASIELGIPDPASPLLLSFDGSGSTDSDGSIMQYEWDFDGDGDFDIGQNQPLASWQFQQAGRRSIVLRVTDDEGAVDTDSYELSLPAAWSMAGADAANSGRSAFRPTGSGKMIWNFRLDGWAANGSPVVSADGTVYMGSQSRSLHAIDNTGQQLWRFQTQNSINTSAALLSDGRIVLSDSWFLHVLNPDGSVDWEYDFLFGEDPPVNQGNPCDPPPSNPCDPQPNPCDPQIPLPVTESLTTPVITLNETILVGSLNNLVHAFSASGELLWSMEDNLSARTRPLVDNEGNIIVCDWLDRVHKISPTGERLWINEDMTSMPSGDGCITPEGLILYGAANRRLYAIRPWGELAWVREMESTIRTSPVHTPDGLIQLFTSAPDTCLLRSDGKLVSVQDADTLALGSTPVYSSNGVCLTNGNKLSLRNPSGDSWEFDWGMLGAGSVAVGNNGNVYACAGRVIYAFGD
jgi:outer membrane protein assembly factor BamB